MFKKLFFSILVCTFILSSFNGVLSVSADSGSSTIPKETALQKYMYSTYAPKSQTTYKKMSTVSISTSKVEKDGKSLEVFGTDVMAGSTVAAGLLGAAKVNPLVLTGVSLVGTVGGGTYFIGKSMQANYSNFKKGTIIKHEVNFKWTNAARFEYSVKINSWAEYKGTKITAVKTSYFNKSL